MTRALEIKTRPPQSSTCASCQELLWCWPSRSSYEIGMIWLLYCRIQHICHQDVTRTKQNTKTTSFIHFLELTPNERITQQCEDAQHHVRWDESSRCEVSPHYKPPGTKLHAVVIEAFGCTLMKTHVFQWDTCNQMSSMIIPPQNNQRR